MQTHTALFSPVRVQQTTPDLERARVAVEQDKLAAWADVMPQERGRAAKVAQVLLLHVRHVCGVGGKEGRGRREVREGRGVGSRLARSQHEPGISVDKAPLARWRASVSITKLPLSRSVRAPRPHGAGRQWGRRRARVRRVHAQATAAAIVVEEDDHADAVLHDLVDGLLVLAPVRGILCRDTPSGRKRRRA